MIEINSKNQEEALSFSPESFPDSKRFYMSSIGVTNPSKGYIVRRDNSDIYSIGYITAGCGVVDYAGRQFEVRKGDTTLFPVGITFQVTSKSDNPQAKIWMGFSGTLCDMMYHEYRLERRFVYKLPYTGTMLQAFWEQCKANERNMDYLALRASLLVHELFASISLSLDEPSDQMHEYASDVKKYIDRRVSEQLRMPEVAQAIGISVSHMNRVFTTVYGMTPAAYHAKCRLDMAANLLVHTGLPIGDISRQLGFTSVRYFSSCFSKEFGRSPRAYRSNNISMGRAKDERESLAP